MADGELLQGTVPIKGRWILRTSSCQFPKKIITLKTISQSYRKQNKPLFLCLLTHHSTVGCLSHPKNAYCLTCKSQSRNLKLRIDLSDTEIEGKPVKYSLENLIHFRTNGLSPPQQPFLPFFPLLKETKGKRVAGEGVGGDKGVWSG